MRHSTVLVVGGSGFVGRHLLNVFAARGVRAIVPTRSRERAKHLILLPTVDVVECDVNAPGVLESLARQCDAVINLAGVLHSRPARGSDASTSRYGPEFLATHVELPRRIVSACRAAGVKRLLHMSALGAAPDAPSEYQRSKADGEQAVLAADDLAVTVFRPSVVFGPEDRFLNLFAKLASFSLVLLVGCPGARFKPVYVRDVAQAIAHALDDPHAAGRRYDLCGPQEYTLINLVRYVCRLTRRRRLVIGLGTALSLLQAFILEHLPGKLMTRDNVRSMKAPNVSDAPLPFGLAPTALEAAAPLYMASAAPRDRLRVFRNRARR